MAQACPFLFPGELACPDVPGQAHSGRAETKTPVPMGLWTTLFSHRSEPQWGANWSFSYLRWNYWFRSNLNAAKPLICTRHIKDAAGPLTAAEVLQGATQITRALRGGTKQWQSVEKRTKGGKWVGILRCKAGKAKLDTTDRNHRTRSGNPRRQLFDINWRAQSRARRPGENCLRTRTFPRRTTSPTKHFSSYAATGRNQWSAETNALYLQRHAGVLRIASVHHHFPG